MNFFCQFRRLLFLLLSLTLSAQSMAVASLGACHKVKALALLSAQVSVSASHRSHGDVATQHGSAHVHGKQGAVAAHSGDSEDRSTQDGGRVKCVACAACHAFSVVLPTETALADIPVSGSVSFPESASPRVRNVANGLERPPRA